MKTRSHFPARRLQETPALHRQAWSEMARKLAMTCGLTKAEISHNAQIRDNVTIQDSVVRGECLVFGDARVVCDSEIIAAGANP